MSPYSFHCLFTQIIERVKFYWKSPAELMVLKSRRSSKDQTTFNHHVLIPPLVRFIIDSIILKSRVESPEFLIVEWTK